jgi:hypothetical protein
MKLVYLVLAIIGALVPVAFFVPFFQTNGFSFSGFIAALFVNGAAGGFSADLLISSLAFWLFMFVNRQRGKGPRPLPFVLVNLLIGLSCALPAYLYFREK